MISDASATALPPVLPARAHAAPGLGALRPGRTLTCTFQHEERTERLTLAAANRDDLVFAEANSHRFLHPEEIATLGGLTVDKRHHDYLLGRYAAKSAGTVWSGARDMRTFAIVPGAFSQPVVNGNLASCLGVTLAHGDGVAVAVAHDAGHPMGIDLERVTADKFETVRAQATSDERALVAKCGTTESEALMLLWCAREAVSKALRCGLTCPMRILAVRSFEPSGGGWYRGEYANFGQYQFIAWLNGPFAVALAASTRADLAPQVGRMRAFLAESCAS